MVICRKQADQSFLDIESGCKYDPGLAGLTLTNHNILGEPSSIFVLSYSYVASFYVFRVFFFK